MHRVLSAALTLSLVAARLAVGQIGLTELATVTLGRPVQGMLPGTVIADISNQCGVCAQGAFFVVDLAGPGIIPGVNSAYVVLRRWSDPDGADPALYCPLAPLGFLGARANLVYEIVATDAGQVVIFGAHQPLPGQPVQYLIQVTAGLTGPQPHIIYREGDSYADAPAGVASSAVFDFAYAGPDHLLVMALLTGAGVTPADDRIALTGSVRNNMRKLMREGEQPPASPAESLTHSLTGLGPVTCTSEGWGLVPASLRIPGSDPNLVRACLYLYSL
ncbi:MAG TPA: hypothetical protein VFF65_00735, partial [Phycisphaerales bacterium]|nr:hypothetical protein [Phycisphaerales bacterium]